MREMEGTASGSAMDRPTLFRVKGVCMCVCTLQECLSVHCRSEVHSVPRPTNCGCKCWLIQTYVQVAGRVLGLSLRHGISLGVVLPAALWRLLSSQVRYCDIRVILYRYVHAYYVKGIYDAAYPWESCYMRPCGECSATSRSDIIQIHGKR